MYIRFAEYMFGRFGFNDAHTEAQSFLFFTARTNFFNTKFPGEENPLRKFETELERFQRGLREGRDYSGIEDMRKLHDYPSIAEEGETVINIFQKPPPFPEQPGPYSISEHVLKAEDVQALRVCRPPREDAEAALLQSQYPPSGHAIQSILEIRYGARIAEFIDPWKEPTYDLLNELVLSYLEHFVLPDFRLDRSPSMAGRALFPRYGQTTARGDKEFDTYLYSYFTKPLEKPVPGIDAAAVGTRIQDFLFRRAGGDDISVDSFNLEKCIQGITRVVGFLVSEILECSHRDALGQDRADLRKHCRRRLYRAVNRKACSVLR
jgi:hypothetical protein